MAERAALTGGQKVKRMDQTLLSQSRPPLGALQREVSLAETLDRVLHKGAVVVGEMTISVADIDLVYLGLNVLLTSVDTIKREGGQSHVAKFESSS